MYKKGCVNDAPDMKRVAQSDEMTIEKQGTPLRAGAPGASPYRRIAFKAFNTYGFLREY